MKAILKEIIKEVIEEFTFSDGCLDLDIDDQNKFSEALVNKILEIMPEIKI